MSGDTTAQAAWRRAAFLREEVESGRVPADHPLGAAYLTEAAKLEAMFPFPGGVAVVTARPVRRSRWCELRHRRDPDCSDV